MPPSINGDTAAVNHRDNDSTKFIDEYSHSVDDNVKHMLDIVSEWVKYDTDHLSKQNIDGVLSDLQTQYDTLTQQHNDVVDENKLLQKRIKQLEQHSHDTVQASQSLHTSALQDANTTITQLTARIDRYEADQAELDNIIVVLRNGEAELLRDNKMLSEQLDSIHSDNGDELKSVTKQCKMLQSTIDAQMIEIAQLTDAAAQTVQLKVNNAELIQQQRTIDDALQQAQRALELHQQSNADLQRRMEELNTELLKYQTDSAAEDTHAKQLQQAVNDKQIELDQLRVEHNELQAQLSKQAQLQNENQQLQEQIEALQSAQQNQLDSSSTMFEIERSTIQERQEQLDKSFADLANLRDGLQSLQQNSNADEVNKLRQQVVELQTDKLSLQQHVDELQDSQRQLQSRLADALEERNELQSRASAAIPQTAESDSTSQQQQQQQHDEESAQQILVLQQTVHTLTADKEELIGQIGMLHTAAQQLPPALIDPVTQQQIHALAEQLSTTVQELQQVKQQYTMLQNNYEAIADNQNDGKSPSVQRSLFHSPAPSTASLNRFATPSSTSNSTLMASPTRGKPKASSLKRKSVVTINNLPAQRNNWLEVVFVIQLVLLVLYLCSDALAGTSVGQQLTSWIQTHMSSTEATDNARQIYTTYGYR